MSEAKRERRRLERARKRKHKLRIGTQRAQGAARELRAACAAYEAETHLRQGEVGDAVRAAARAVALNPRDPETALLYVAATKSCGDALEERRALEHLCRIIEPGAEALIRLAFLCLRTGEPGRAHDLTIRARARLPRRMKDRKRWLAFLEFVEAEAEAAAAKTGAEGPHSSAAELSRPTGEPRVPLDEPRAALPHGASEPRRTGECRRDGSLSLFPGASAPGASAPWGLDAAAVHAGEAAADAAAEPAPASEAPAPRLLEIPVEIAAEVDGVAVLANRSFGSLEEVRLATLAAKIRDAESFDRLFSVEHAQGLLHLSHQEETARKVLSGFLGRALLADEVGLGKTIEAGLVLSEYLLRGRIESALVLAPPSLVGQWRGELASKFGIETRTTEDAVFRSDAAGFWSGPGVVVASLATARSARQRDAVTARAWDLVIVDEAHALKNSRTESYALVSRLTSRFLLLLTATPVENRIEELYNLVSLLRPGHLGGRSAFVRRFADPRGRVTETARREVRALLGEVMVRNTRALSGVRLPPRFARTVLVEPDPAERELYEHLMTALRALGAGGRTRLLLSILLQEAGSSPHAVRATLAKVGANPELSAAAVEALAPAMAFAERPVETGKAAALLRVLDGSREGAVVFTRFRATLDFLSGVLERRGVAYERMDGATPAPVRREAVERCREGAAVLLSTDVGSEGLNLQFFRRIINFDLPWNPMRIEQRIGRVHRIGQDQAVNVVNFCLAGSIEERILRILDERINLFELIVGEVDMILGHLEEDQEFPDLMLNAFAEPEAERRERSFERIADALAAARQRYENVKTFDEAFFRNELGV